LKAIHVPQAGITDYKLVSKKIYEILKHKGVEFKFNTKVLNIKNELNYNKVFTDSSQEIKSNYVINVAGLYSDKLAKLNFKIDYKIIPFRGEYYNLKPSASYLVKNLIYPVPNPKFPFLGVHFTRRINNSIESGPNAVFAFSREGYKKSIINFKELFESITYIGFLKLIKLYWKDGVKEMYRSVSKQAYLKSLQKLIPKIKINDIYSGSAGVRAQAVKSNGDMVDDFLIISKNNIINVCNAPSPAATASFAIGEHITKLIKK
jgi:L-2-hydroxyglutarate oxidase